MTNVIDFARSFMTFHALPRQGNNIARIQYDAICRIHSPDPAKTQTWVLIAPCRSERMYAEGALFLLPNYEFSGIFSSDHVSLIRTHWTSDRETPEIAAARDRFDRVELDPVSMPADHLTTTEAIVAATLANRRLVARTTLTMRDGRQATLEYPIKTMNVTTDPQQFQVDTGPLILPETIPGADPGLASCGVAHVVYCRLDRAEFILRQPHLVGGPPENPIRVTDYSEVEMRPASHELWAER